MFWWVTATMKSAFARCACATAATLSRVWLTAVRCGITVKPNSSLRIDETWAVRSWVLPPAPYVTETKSGSIRLNAAAVSRNAWTPASSLGGKNSSDRSGLPSSSNSEMGLSDGGGWWADMDSMIGAKTGREVIGRAAGMFGRTT